MSMTTKSADRKNAEATKPKTNRRTKTKTVTTEEVWRAVTEKRLLTQRFANLIVELDGIGREMRVAHELNDTRSMLKEYKRLRKNSQARKRVKREMAKVAILILRFEQQNKVKG